MHHSNPFDPPLDLEAAIGPPDPRQQECQWDDGAAEINRAINYLWGILSVVSPGLQPLPDLIGLCTQMDHLLAGAIAEREQFKREVDVVSGMLNENRDMAVKALADAKDTILALLKSGGAFDVPTTLEEIDSAICCLEQTTSA